MSNLVQKEIGLRIEIEECYDIKDETVRYANNSREARGEWSSCSSERLQV